MNSPLRRRVALAAATLALLTACCSLKIRPGDQCDEHLHCASPPLPTCSEQKLVVYESAGTCFFGYCGYARAEAACDQGCAEGASRCSSSAGEGCDHDACPQPPSPSCADQALVSWESTCLDEGAGPAWGFAVGALTPCARGCEPDSARCRETASAIQIDNPYQAVDWQRWSQYKANLHTHTTESGGSILPGMVIDLYHGAGYQVLAITDHNENTWPWSRWRRDAAALGMVALSGNELSDGHHMNALLAARHGPVSSDNRAALDVITADGGLAVLNHPGRYYKPLQWLVDLYYDYPALVGLEVYNQGDRYPGDRAIWDAILTVMMPERPVWGHSADDMHDPSHLFGNYSLLLLPTLSEAEVRAALTEGRSYFSYEPGRSGQARAPRILAISVDQEAGTIHIDASGQPAIHWIADGESIAQGATLDVAALVDAGQIRGYVRAQLVGEHGRTYTQPFGVR